MTEELNNKNKQNTKKAQELLSQLEGYALDDIKSICGKMMRAADRVSIIPTAEDLLNALQDA